MRSRLFFTRMVMLAAILVSITWSGHGQQPQHARTNSASAAKANFWHMRKVDVTTQVMDLQTHGGRSILGMTMLVPSDWDVSGSGGADAEVRLQLHDWPFQH